MAKCVSRDATVFQDSSQPLSSPGSERCISTQHSPPTDVVRLRNLLPLARVIFKIRVCLQSCN